MVFRAEHTVQDHGCWRHAKYVSMWSGTTEKGVGRQRHGLQSLHEDLLHFLGAPGSSCGLAERDGQLLGLMNWWKRAWLLPGPSLIEARQKISKSAGLSDNAAGASLQRDLAPL